MRMKIVSAASWADPAPDKPPCDGAVWDPTWVDGACKPGAWVVDLATMGDLLALVARARHSIIVSKGGLTIYDSYIE